MTYSCNKFKFPAKIEMAFYGKVEIILEQREVSFLSPSKICKHLNFSRDIQSFANFSW